MARQDILLIGLDYNSLRILEISLRKSGFMVVSATSLSDALEELRIALPDLIIIDSSGDREAFEFATRLKSDYKTVPLILISSNKEVNTRIRALEIGIDDYLVKPIYIKEIIARAKIHLQRKERDRIGEGITAGFMGSLSDIGLYDIVQTIETNRKSGILEIKGKIQEGRIYFKNGQIVQASIGKYRGEPAVYRMLTLNEGVFKMSFLDIDIEPEIKSPNNAIIIEGMRRLDEYMKYTEQLPPLTTRLDIDDNILKNRLKEIPDNVNKVLKLIDSERSINDIIEVAEIDELEVLKIISALYFDGIVYDIFARHPVDEKRISSTLPEPAPLPRGDVRAERIGVIEQTSPSPLWAEGIFKEVKGTLPLTASQSEIGEMAIADEMRKDETPSTQDTKIDIEGPATPADNVQERRERPTEPHSQSPEAAGEEKERAEINPQLRHEHEEVIFGDDSSRSTRDKVIEKTLLDNVISSTSSYVKGSLLSRQKRTTKSERSRPAISWLFIVLIVILGGGGFAIYKWIYKEGTHLEAYIPTLSKNTEEERIRTETEMRKRLEEEQREAEIKATEEVEAKKMAEEARKEVEEKGEGAGSGSNAKEAITEKAEREVIQSQKVQKREEGRRRAAIEIDIKGYKDLLNSAQNLYKVGNSKGARRELKQALTKNPRGFEAFTLLGQIELESNRIGSAITYLKRAISYNNRYAPAYFYLGTSYQLNGDNTNAKKMYNRYLKLAPRGEFAQDVRAILPDLR